MTGRVKAVLLAAVAAAAATLAAAAVWFGALNQDEGWYLYAAQSVRGGLLPYRDFFFTQGPTMPFVYSVLAPIWMSPLSPLKGLLGGRVVTAVLGIAASLVFAAFARRTVRPARRFEAGLVVFAVLSCNLYHVYFTAIPKTYALGSLFLAIGFLFFACALGVRRLAPRICAFAVSGLSMALASGTRISLVLAIGATGLSLLVAFRRRGWAFLWFAIGAAAGLFLVYGTFALDRASLAGLLAAQKYHAARGGFDLFFAIGSVSRLARAYIGVAIALAAALALAMRRPPGPDAIPEDGAFALKTAGAAFLAVFLLQLSAPFPYDDYQVPVMGILAAIAGALFASSLRDDPGEEPVRRFAAPWFVFLAVAVASFGSPLLQEWFTAGTDRFWTFRKERSDLAGLRAAAKAVEAADPGGTALFTQDLYLAVECGRKVPRGLEMGPFSLFPELPRDRAEALHVENLDMMRELIGYAPSAVAAFSGYGFAIAAPKCEELPFGVQRELWELLKKKYVLADAIPSFGQHGTTLLILKRK